VSRPSRQGFIPHNRERLRMESVQAAPLREIYPQLAELRVEFEFEGGTECTPSPQTFAYYPAARGYFRYACPCHNCSGEFDLSSHVAELAGAGSRARRSRRVEVVCTGQRAQQDNVRSACPICARIHVSAVLHSAETKT
jgi:hypothetical protein